MSLPRPFALAAALVTLAAGGRTATAPFPLVHAGFAAPLVISRGDFEVVRLAAADLAHDIATVTGSTPEILPAPPRDASLPRVLVGTLGRSPAIDDLVATGRLDVSELRGRWETFLLAALPAAGPDSAPTFAIVGSDRRGTAFGIYELSQQIGVSPWHWWADVPPRHRAELLLPAVTRRLGPPSVRFRGIFLNDEDWGLQPWAARTFDPACGDIGPKTYARVFELLLRLKANTLWPAMHACTRPFNADPADAVLADRYAIVMGSSHAEPMLRDNVREWTAPHADYNYVTHRAEVRAYWDERLAANGHYENLYTLGMRGIHDSGIQGAATDSARVAVLGQVFADQHAILAARARPDGIHSPRIFCAYKEVLGLYRQGLRVPDDVTIVWPDDNFGYIRDFASPAERRRSGGFGVYYHLSYLGAPLSYLWLSTTPPGLVWEEMTRAFAHGADRVWIANVGDLKPAELDTEFFLRLAWDIRQWGPDAQSAFLRATAARDFGPAHADAIAAILSDYYRLNFQRRPEHLQWWLPGESPRPSPFRESEIDTRLATFADLRARADRVAAALDASLRDAFTELVGYPVHASALANLRYFAGERGDLDTARAADTEISARTADYNDTVAGGKWRRILAAEPADGQWTRFRIARWRPPAFTRPVDPPLDRLAAVDAGAFNSDSKDVTTIAGLGRTGHAVALAPDTRAHYTLDLPAGPAVFHFQLVPTFPTSGGDQHWLVTLDDQPARLLSLPPADGSAAWARGVLDAAREVSASFDVPSPGRHTVTVSAPSDGFCLDRIVVTRGPGTPGYFGSDSP